MYTKEQKVTEVLNSFLQTQGYTDVKAKYVKLLDSYYAPGAECSEIVLGGISNLKADEVFMKYCRGLGLSVDISIETMSFLHELGHHNTLDFLEDSEIIASDFIKMLLYMEDDESEEGYMKYFTCPVEEQATIDAVDFCNHSPNIVINFDKELLEALYE